MHGSTPGLGLFMLVSALIGCAAFKPTLTGSELDAVYLDKVAAKAAFDFDCPTSKLSITKVSAFTYGASGCGHRATYHPIGAYCAQQEVFEDHAKNTCSVASDTRFDDSSAEQMAIDQEQQDRQRRLQQQQQQQQQLMKKY